MRQRTGKHPRRKCNGLNYKLAGSSDERIGKLLIAIKKLDDTLKKTDVIIEQPLTSLQKFEKNLALQIQLFKNANREKGN